MANILLEEKSQIYHPVSLKFAQPLYDMQKEIYKIARLKEPVKDRALLQYLGTDWARSIDSDIWANIWRKEVRSQLLKHGQGTKMVVLNDDCRFTNEAQMVKSLGGTIISLETPRAFRALRGSLVNEDHKSESGIPDSLIDHRIWNMGSKQDLYWELKVLMQEKL